MSHVLEHLSNGNLILAALCRKLKPGGSIYVEWPGPRSLTLPSAHGTLQFCDDQMHARVFDLKEIANILLANGCVVKKAGVRREIVRILLSPLSLAVSLWYWIRARQLGPGLWDFFGFAEYCYAEKRR